MKFIDEITEDQPGMSEIQIQTKAVQWIHNNLPQTRKLLFHVPNGEQRNKVTGMQLKASGVVAGVPDLLFVWNGILYANEVKTPDGYLSKSQKELHTVWTDNSIPIVVSRSSKDIIEWVLNIVYPNAL